MYEDKTLVIEDEAEKIGFGNVLLKVKRLLNSNSLLVIKDRILGYRDKCMLIKKMGFKLIHLRKVGDKHYEYMLILDESNSD